MLFQNARPTDTNELAKELPTALRIWGRISSQLASFNVLTARDDFDRKDDIFPPQMLLL